MALLTAVLMVSATRTFVKIVSHPFDRRDLSLCFVWTQVTCVILLDIVWICQGFFLAFHLEDYYSYGPTRNIVILDGLSFIVCLGFFLIMAFVIYQSSKI